MNDSSRSNGRRGKAARRARVRRSRARRLGIETMEGRVLLSGNTLDLSTFAADLTPASYAAAIVPPVDQAAVMLTSEIRWYSTLQSATLSEGGFADAAMPNTPRLNYGNVSSDYLLSNISTDAVFGTDLQTHVAGGPSPDVVLYSTGGVPNVSGLDHDAFILVARDSQGALTQAIIPRVITPLWNVEGNQIASAAPEGGSISVASIRMAFSPPTLAENAQSNIAAAYVDREGNLGESHDSAVAKSLASAQIDGEWTRAIAMESVSSSGSLAPTDHRPSREAMPESAPKTSGRGPVSSNSARTHATDGRPDSVVAGEQIDGPVDQLIGLPLSADRAADSPRVAPVAFTSAAATNGEMVLAPAHRLEASGRGVRQAVANRSTAAELARDDVYSKWHPSLAADANLNSADPSEHRLWLNPGPFLAVLALERFVALEPRENRESRNNSSSLTRARRD